MAGSKSSKRVAADKSGGGGAAGVAAAKGNTTLMRARDGSGFIKCEECKKDVPVVLIDMHSCSLDSKIRMHLESQVVEQVHEKKKAAAPKKRKSPSSEGKEGKGRKKSSKNSDGTKRKRPSTAFFLFMADFRKEYAAAHPDNKSVSEVAKEGGAKWKAMSDEEKQQYIDKAAELKAEFEKAAGNVDEVVGVEDGSDKEEAGTDGNEEEGEAEEKETSENEDDE